MFRNAPDEEMEVLMERYRNKLEYKRGSIMTLADLQRFKMTEAAAVLILADREAEDADADDAANIMRIVAIKNLCATMRVIIQISGYHNKVIAWFETLFLEMRKMFYRFCFSSIQKKTDW